MNPLLRFLDIFENVLWREDRDRICIQHFVVADLEVFRLAAVHIGKKIVQTLHVDLEVVHLNFERGTLLFNLLIHISKKVKDRPRNNSIHLLDILIHVLLPALDSLDDLFGTQHAESLARSTLTIGENGSVVSLCELLDSFSGSVTIHLELGCIQKDVVEGESISFKTLVLIMRCSDLSTRLVEIPAILLPIAQLLVTLEPNDNLDRVIVTPHDLGLLLPVDVTRALDLPR